MTRPFVATLAANAFQPADGCQAYTFPDFDHFANYLTALLDAQVPCTVDNVDEAKRSLPAFSAGEYRNKQSKASSIVLDIDEFPEGRSFDDAVAVIRKLGLRAFAYESPGSRLKPGPKRGRLVIHTDRDLTPEETRRICHSLVGKIPGVSAAAIGAGRLNFLGHVAGEAPRDRYDLPGLPFPVDGYLATLPAVTQEMPRVAPPDRPPTPTEIQLAEEKLARELDMLAQAPNGQKHHRLVQACTGIGKVAWALPHRRPEDLYRMILGALARASSPVADWAAAEATARQCLERAFAAPDADLSLKATVLDYLHEGEPANDTSPHEAGAGEDRLWGDDIFDPIEGERYSIPGLHISTGSRFTLFSGPPGCGKSYALADLLFALATGEQIWHRFSGPKEGAVDVLHLDWEQGENQVRRRYQEIALGRKQRPKGKLHYVRPIDWYLNSDGGMTRLRELIVKTGAKVVAIDCLRAAIVGVDENDSRFTEPLRSGLSRLTKELGVDFIVLHHAKKDGTGIRGSGDIEGSCGEHFEFSREGGDVVIKHARSQSEPAFDGAMLLRKVNAPPTVGADGIPDLNAPSSVVLDARAAGAEDHARHYVARQNAKLAKVQSAVSELETAGIRQVTTEHLASYAQMSKSEVAAALTSLESTGRLFNHLTAKDPAWRTVPIPKTPGMHGMDLTGPPKVLD
jgi:hypothetical protein